MGVLKGKKLTPLEIARVAYKAGVPLGQLAICVAICNEESRYYTEAFNGNVATGDKSYGLWQINMIGGIAAERKAKYNLKGNDDLYIPAINARVMFDMSKGGTNWKPWGAYSNGRYRNHLAEGKEAVRAMQAPTVVAKVVQAVKKVVRPSTPWAYANVGPGQDNNSVKVVQAALIKLGYKISTVSGYWGSQTSLAYAAFQRSLGFQGSDADGVPGPTSLTALAKKSGFYLK